MIQHLERGAARAQDTTTVLKCAEKVAQSDRPLPFTPALEAEMQGLNLASAERVFHVATGEFALANLVKYSQAAEAPRNAILELVCSYGTLKTGITPKSAPRCHLNPWLSRYLQDVAAAQLPRDGENLPGYTSRLMFSQALETVRGIDAQELFAEAAHDAVVALLDTRRLQVAPELIARQCERLRNSLADFGVGEGWLHATLHVVFATAHFSDIADGMVDDIRLATLDVAVSAGCDTAVRLSSTAVKLLGAAPKQQVPGILSKVGAALPWIGLPGDVAGVVVSFISVAHCIVGDKIRLGGLGAIASVNAWAACEAVVADTALESPEYKERLTEALITFMVLQPDFDPTPLLLATLQLPHRSAVRLATVVLRAAVVSHCPSEVLSGLCVAADGALSTMKAPPVLGPVWTTACELPDEITLENGALSPPAAALLLVLVRNLRSAKHFSDAASNLNCALLSRWSVATKRVGEAALFHACAWRLVVAKNAADIRADTPAGFINEVCRAESPWRPLFGAAIFRMPIHLRAEAAQTYLNAPMEERPWPTAATHPALFHSEEPEHGAFTNVQRLLVSGTVGEVVGAMAGQSASFKGPMLVAVVVDTALRGDLADAFRNEAAVAALAKIVAAEEDADYAVWKALLSLAAGIGADVLIAASHGDDVLSQLEDLRSIGPVWSQLLTLTAYCLSADASTNHFAMYFRDPSRAKRRRGYAFGDSFEQPIIHGLDCAATVLGGENPEGGPGFLYSFNRPWPTDGRAFCLSLYYVYLALVGHVLLFPTRAHECSDTAVTVTAQRSAVPEDAFDTTPVARRVASVVVGKVLELRGLQEQYAWRDDFDAVFHRLAPVAVASTPCDRDVYTSNTERAEATERFVVSLSETLVGATAHRRALTRARGNVAEWTANATRDAPRLLEAVPASSLTMSAPGVCVIAAAQSPEVHRALSLLSHMPPLARLHVHIQRKHGPGARGTLADLPLNVAAQALDAQNKIAHFCKTVPHECNPAQTVTGWGALDSVAIAAWLPEKPDEATERLAFTAAIDSLTDSAKQFAAANVTLPGLPEAKAVLAAAAPLVLVPRGRGLLDPRMAHLAALVRMVAGLTDAPEVTAAVLQVAVAVPLLVLHDGFPSIDALQCGRDRRESSVDAPPSDREKLDVLQEEADRVGSASQPALPHDFFAAAQSFCGDAAAAASVLRDAAFRELRHNPLRGRDVPLAELLPAEVEGNEARTQHLLSLLPECWMVQHAKAVFDVLVSVSETSSNVALQRGLDTFQSVQFHEHLPPGLDVLRKLTEAAQKLQSTQDITEMSDHLGLAAEYLAGGVTVFGDIQFADFIKRCQDDLWPPLARLLGVQEDCELRTTHALRLWAAFTSTISTLQLRRFQEDVGARWVELEDEMATPSEVVSVAADMDSAPSSDDCSVDDAAPVQEKKVMHFDNAVRRLVACWKSHRVRTQCSAARTPHKLIACPADVPAVVGSGVVAANLLRDEANLDEQSHVLLKLIEDPRRAPRRGPDEAVFMVPQIIPPAEFRRTETELQKLQKHRDCSRKILENVGLQVGRALVLPWMISRPFHRVPPRVIAIVREGDGAPPVVSRRLRYLCKGRWKEEERDAFALSPVSLVVSAGADRGGVPCNRATGHRPGPPQRPDWLHLA